MEALGLSAVIIGGGSGRRAHKVLIHPYSAQGPHSPLIAHKVYSDPFVLQLAAMPGYSLL